MTDTFLKSIENLKPQTILNHKRQLNKYRELFNESLDGDESDILFNIEEKSNLNLSARLTLLKTISKYRNVNELSNNKILVYMNDINNQLNKKYKKRNKELKDNLPTYRDLIKALSVLYKANEYQKYILNYLIIHHNLRNLDLDLYLVSHMKDTKDKSKNYLIVRKNDVVMVRNQYKTSKTYGPQKTIIKSKPFRNAVIKYIENYESTDESNDIRLLQGVENNLSYYLKKLIMLGLNQSTIVKIILNEKNSLNQASKISKNRNTAISTLQTNYNLNV